MAFLEAKMLILGLVDSLFGSPINITINAGKIEVDIL